ncbi:Potassium transporter [Parasponia andersonii]|uniref:Potassium transporter n=1 Tax=Parasponia andersonii TaxID=3476 RepID=A0A2P5DBL2_PARAD|nr:Potassium transporter [Parasponia andersonii]
MSNQVPDYDERSTRVHDEYSVEERAVTDHQVQEDQEEEKEEEREEASHEKGLKAKKLSWHKLRRYDSLDVESRSVRGRHAYGAHGSKASADWSVILHLAFQSIGIVYGDIGTSPLYVYSSTFTEGIKHNDDILGVLSLIFYTITLIPLIKYVFVVLKANDNGDGGTFALYSLICRYAKVGLTPNEQAEDRDVSNFELELPSNSLKRASKLKSKLENTKFAKYFLLFATMLGTSMVIGDGVLTPCISVLSAVGGIKEAKSTMSQDMIVWISVAILICLFMVQRFGTDKVGYSFAPIICIWFALIAGIGLHNFVKFDPSVVKAINPKYIFDYFHRNKKQAWISLGGIVLAITGTEALFADVGHFTVRSIQLSMCCVTYPALIMAYTGQASFLRKHNDVVSDTFYKSIPKSFYWPMFVVAVAAAIIASQAMISGTFSIVQQSLSLGCFPRVKIVHTSTKYEGQVYVPEVNYLLMVACVAVTLGFKTTTKIGNAYGIAVVFVMTLTSSFLVLIMIMIWKTNILLIITYVVIIGSVELLYLSSVLYKFDQGGYLPLAFAGLLMAVMFVWNNVYRRKYYYELDHKISPEKIAEITNETNLCRLPGLAMFYSELVQGIPPIFKHYAANVPALHSVLVFVSIKSLPISKVPQEERFLFRRVEPRNLYVFRCVARYGYTDVRNENEPFEKMLFEKLKEFMRSQFWLFHIETSSNGNGTRELVDQNNVGDSKEGLFAEENGENHGDEVGKEVSKEKSHEMLDREIEELDRAWRAGVVHLIGENEVVAAKGAGIGKRIMIDYAYNFLKKNLRQTDKVFDIPHKRLLKVGMTYEL